MARQNMADGLPRTQLCVQRVDGGAWYPKDQYFPIQV
jgi:hypothetical protein